MLIFFSSITATANFLSGDAVKLWAQERYDEVVRASSVVQKLESVWKSCEQSESIASAINEGLAEESSPEVSACM